MTNEPVALGTAVGALIPLVGTATTAFNAWNPTPDQIGALAALYSGVLIVIGLIVRKKVTPVVTAAPPPA